MNPVYDKHGREIKHGDLMKTYHFRAALRRQHQYLYHVARYCPEHDRMQGIPFHELAGDGLEAGGRFWLVGEQRWDTEVIACAGAEFLPERPKVKR
jgi:hypothetical protein